MRPMITSGRRAKRPDGAVYRRLRRQPVAGRTVLEATRASAGGAGGDGAVRGAGVLQAIARSFTFLAHLLRRR